MRIRCISKSDKGFTLIETIVYIGLFALIIGGLLPSVYSVLQGTAQLGGKSTVQNEESFVLRKIDWALASMETLTTPSAFATPSTSLWLTRYDGSTVAFRLSGDVVEINENGAGFMPITTVNVKVTSLSFDYIAPSGSGPAGVTATIVMNGEAASTTRYIRK